VTPKGSGAFHSSSGSCAAGNPARSPHLHPLTLSPNGRQLVKCWVGCRRVAYPDSGSGGETWTIGYGHTGPEVVSGLVSVITTRKPGSRWTQLRQQMVRSLHPRLWHQASVATGSWAFRSRTAGRGGLL
jgi:GH24 family phage-related lysozyme (muramidase)